MAVNQVLVPPLPPLPPGWHWYWMMMRRHIVYGSWLGILRS
jgi:hypothetical protein